MPGLDIYQTEDEENFIKDSYVFKSLLPSLEEEVEVDFEKE
jgi:hypothetical protein